jgi:hypothetical protein
VGPFTSAISAIVVCCGISPQEDVARERVDLVEVNHFYDEQGRLVFDQTIFYDWSASHSRYMVRAWRLVKNPAQLPQRDWQDGGYTAVWHDGEVLRHIHAESMRETWTQYDPELIEREYLPKEQRRELRIVKIERQSQSAMRPVATAAAQESSVTVNAAVERR